MKVKVIFFAPFRDLFNAEEGEFELNDAPSVQGLLDILCDSEERHNKIFDDSGELRPHVRILKNGLYIKSLNGIQTELEDGDEVAIFPPIAGG
jgi:molybdopterin synthase sulfur carrier subunit